MTQQNKWTKGPWELGPAKESTKVFSGDTVIAEAMPTTINYDEAHANARLIAKAPEMAEALKAVHSTYRTFRDVPKEDQQWTQLDDDAIALIESLLSSIHNGGEM